MAIGAQELRAWMKHFGFTVRMLSQRKCVCEASITKYRREGAPDWFTLPKYPHGRVANEPPPDWPPK